MRSQDIKALPIEKLAAIIALSRIARDTMAAIE
jgi:hypothetical protein